MGSAVSKFFTLCSSPNVWVKIHYFDILTTLQPNKTVELGSSKHKLQIKAIKKKSVYEKYKPQNPPH